MGDISPSINLPSHTFSHATIPRPLFYRQTTSRLGLPHHHPLRRQHHHPAHLSINTAQARAALGLDIGVSGRCRQAMKYQAAAVLSLCVIYKSNSKSERNLAGVVYLGKEMTGL